MKIRSKLLLALALCVVASTTTAFAVGCVNTIPEQTHTQHSFTEEVAEEKYLKSEATCTEKAVYYYSCTCGEKGTETFEYGEPNGHDYVDGVCASCKDPQPPTEGLEYRLNDDGTAYTVVGIGTATDTVVVIPSTYGDNNLPVTEIGDSAFTGYIVNDATPCSKIESFVIPDSVKIIGKTAFSHCSKLTSIKIPNSVTDIGEAAFKNCYNLTDVTLSDSLTSIAEELFSSCEKIKSIRIPNSVTSIGENAFGWCWQLESLEIPEKVSSIHTYAFWDCSRMKSITVAEENAYYASVDRILYNKSKTYIIFVPTSIEGAVSIPNGVTNIPERAFYRCRDLTSVDIPDSVKWIGKEAFNSCRSLTSIVIPEGVKDIEAATFYDCNALASVTLPSSLTSIGEYAFCSSVLTSIVIPNGVTIIGNRAFYCCYELTSVTLPDSVTNIDDEAFSCCKALTSINIPNSVTRFGQKAFSSCLSLKSIIIPISVTYIGSNAFAECGELTIYCEAESKPSNWYTWNPDNRPVVWGYKGEE